MTDPTANVPTPEIPMLHLPRLLLRLARRLPASHALVAGIALAGAPWARSATAPADLMTYQGFLVDDKGAALATTKPVNYPITFRIYDEESSGTLKWAETQIVTVDKGNFSVVLGQGSDSGSEPRPALSSIFSGAKADQRYLEISVKLDGDTPFTLTPRLRLLPTPYAFLASLADSATRLVGSDGAAFVGLSADGVFIDQPVRLENTSIGGTLSLGDNVARTKIALFDGTSEQYGLGISGADGGQFVFHLGDRAEERYTFLGGAPEKELLRVRGNGNVEVPSGKLSVSGEVNGTSLVSSGNISASGGISTAGSLAAGASSLGALTAQSVTTSGRLSLGTTTEKTKIALFEGGADTYGMGIAADGQFQLHLGNRDNERFAFLGGASSHKEIMTVRADGRVGINTANPTAPLDVGGTLTVSGSFLRVYYDKFGDRTDEFTANENVSIRAAGAIMTGTYLVHSDARLKKNIAASDSAADLRSIRNLALRDYDMIDTIGSGNRRHKGVVAQEAREVLPGAVSMDTRVVPDIFAPCARFEHDPATGLLTLHLSKPHAAAVGERIRIVTDRKTLDLPVHAVPSKDSVVLRDCTEAPEELFVYGREVSDFLSVDYDHLFVTGLGAIQELARREAAQAERIRDLESRVSRLNVLEEKLAAVSSRLESSEQANARWEARFKALELRLASDTATPRSPELPEAPRFAGRSADR